MYRCLIVDLENIMAFSITSAGSDDTTKNGKQLSRVRFPRHGFLQDFLQKRFPLTLSRSLLLSVYWRVVLPLALFGIEPLLTETMTHGVFDWLTGAPVQT